MQNYAILSIRNNSHRQDKHTFIFQLLVRIRSFLLFILHSFFFESNGKIKISIGSHMSVSYTESTEMLLRSTVLFPKRKHEFDLAKWWNVWVLFSFSCEGNWEIFTKLNCIFVTLYNKRFYIYYIEMGWGKIKTIRRT